MASKSASIEAIKGAALSNYGATLGEVQKAPRQLYGIPRICWLILVVEFAERLVFYSLNGTQEFFLERVGISLSRAAGLNATMSTLCCVWALGASWVSDAILGSPMTILVSGLMYFAGVSLSAIAALPGRENVPLYFVGVLGLLPIATAGIKSNISNLGADQCDTTTAEGKASQEKFFSVFYLSINLGSGLSYGFFTTFAANGGMGVPVKYGYAATYAMMAVCMLSAVLIFLWGRSGYRVQPVQADSALGRTTRLILKAARSGSSCAMSLCTGFVLLVISIIVSVVCSFSTQTNNTLSLSAGFCALVGTVMVAWSCMNPAWLASDSNFVRSDSSVEAGPVDEVNQDSSEVQEVQRFLKIMPALFTGTLAFCAIYNSMAYWYQQQACQMNVKVTVPRMGPLMLSGSFFNLADCIAIVLVTPIALKFINPAVEHALGRTLSTKGKFSMGMAIGSASLLVAARLETYRRSSEILAEGSNCAPEGVHMSNISASWMALPYFLVGVAEIYGLVSLMQYCYTECPASMRTLSSAAFFFVQAVSSAVFALETVMLNGYIPNDLNNGHLEYGYLLNLALGLVLYLVFVKLLP